MFCPTYASFKNVLRNSWFLYQHYRPHIDKNRESDSIICILFDMFGDIYATQNYVVTINDLGNIVNCLFRV